MATGSPGSGPTSAFRAARDQLLTLRGEHERARKEFSFPDVGPVFNWAHDWFDAVARGSDRPALVLVEEDGARTSLGFDQLATRSDQVAGYLLHAGVKKGDPVLLMLGNQVALWETMLAVMTLGAVIVPTTTALGPGDLADRIDRGQVRHVVCNPADTPKFADVPGTYGRTCVGQVPG